MDLAVHNNGKILTSRGAAPLAQRTWRQSLVSLWGHLGEVVMAETAIIEAMEAPHTSKTATADDVNGLSLQIAPRRMRKRK